MDRRSFCSSLFASMLASAADAAQRVFDAQSTAEDVTRGIDLTGKVAVVTGCNSGIGLESMRVLALRGAHVIGTARTHEKGRGAARSVVGKATSVELELGDFGSVARCADTITTLTPKIDILMLNAGVLLDRHEQINGLERQFVVNHLGHFVLTHRLLTLVVAAPQGRVVTVGSGNHRDAPAGGIQFDDLSGKTWFKHGYAHSKLANGLFSLELAQRLKDTRATSNCLTPGPVRTSILRNTSSSTEHQTKTPAQGAATQCYVATHPSLAHVSGEYFKDCARAPQSDHQRDRAMAHRLWEISSELTARYL